MTTPYRGMRFHMNSDFTAGSIVIPNPPPLCEIIDIRDGEIVRYGPVTPPGEEPAWVGEVHVMYFLRIVKPLVQ